MLDIVGPTTTNRPPPTVPGTEHGDTWSEALQKINANFAALQQQYQELQARCARLEERLNSAANPTQ